MIVEKLLANGVPVVKARGLAELTDEAVVHAITVNWINDKYSELGLPESAVMNAVTILARPRYRGGITLITRVREKGRRAVLDDYRRDPYAVFEALRREAATFKEFEDFAGGK